MAIPRIDFLLFGYREISVKNEHLKPFLNELLKAGLSLKGENGIYLVSESDYKKIKKILHERVPYSVSDPKGFLGSVKKYKFRFGIFLGIFSS